MNSLPRIRSGLLRHPLDQQVLVYDPRDEQVHLLDPTTACVLDLLEEGTWTSNKIPAELARRIGVASDPDFFSLALDELRQAGLLDENAPLPEPLIDFTRRDVVRKLAMTGAAALLIPAVATLTATPGYAQVSARFGIGRGCTVGGQCLSGFCCFGICATSATCPQGTGANCTLASQCASGICTGGFCQPLIANNQFCSPNGTNASCSSGYCAGGSGYTNTSRCCSSGATNDNKGANVNCTNDNQCCSGSCAGTSPNKKCTAP